MEKWYHYITKTSPVILILVSVGIGILAKLIEKSFTSIAMGLQLITFILFFYALIKLINGKKK